MRLILLIILINFCNSIYAQKFRYDWNMHDNERNKNSIEIQKSKFYKNRANNRLLISAIMTTASASIFTISNRTYTASYTNYNYRNRNTGILIGSAVGFIAGAYLIGAIYDYEQSYSYYLSPYYNKYNEINIYGLTCNIPIFNK